MNYVRFKKFRKYPNNFRAKNLVFRQFRQVCVFSASTIVDRYRGQTSQNEVKLGGHAPCEVRGPSDAIPGLPRQFGQA